MAIYDCFQYFNEDHMVDLRLNILNKHVQKKIITGLPPLSGDDKRN